MSASDYRVVVRGRFFMAEDPTIESRRRERAALGREAARRQWGIPGTARMADLDDAQREIIHSLIDAARAGADLRAVAIPEPGT